MKISKQSLKIITASLLVFVMLLAIALLVNLISLGRVNARTRNLEERLALALNQIEQNEGEIEYRTSPEFIERYGREWLNMKRRGETVFVGR